MNTQYRKPLPGTALDYFDARAAVEAIAPGAYDRLPYTSRVHAENLVRRAEPAMLDAYLTQLIERRRDLDFPWFPARVVCHDILGQTALVDLAGLRDAIAERGGDPAQINPVVPTQLIVDHSLAVEARRLRQGRVRQEPRDRGSSQRGPLPLHQLDEEGVQERRRDPAGQRDHAPDQSGADVAGDPCATMASRIPDTCVGTDSHTPHVDALGVIAIGVGGLEAESVMLGRASWMRLPDIIGVELTGKPQPGITATDIVLALTEFLRQSKVVGAYLEFHGEGASALTLGDRATISNMAPEYGATAAMFFIDDKTIDYLRLTGREDAQVKLVETYAKQAGLWADALATPQYERTLTLRPVDGGAQHGRPVQPAQAPADLGAGRARHRRRHGRTCPGEADARRRGDHRRDHQLHQHQQPAQRHRRRPARAQRQRARPGAQAVGEDARWRRAPRPCSCTWKKPACCRNWSSSASASSASPAPPATA